MTADELERLLTEWGALAKYEEAKSEAGNDFHVLARAREFAPGTRERAAAQLVGRDGGARRKLMARELGQCGVRVVPKSYVDPVPGKTTHKAGPRERIEDSIPPRLKAVHAAALALYRADELAGLALRQEYCAYGSHGTKAYRVSEAVGRKIGIRVYREALARGIGWVHATIENRAEAA
jgi:hypothetical protein